MIGQFGIALGLVEHCLDTDRQQDGVAGRAELWIGIESGTPL